MARLLFVCSGNTCRSPLAAELARAVAADHALDVVVASAGISAVDGAPASGHAQAVAAALGGSLTDHRSMPVSGGLLGAADLVLTMTGEHRDRLLAEWPALSDRILTLGEAAGFDQDVADPFGGDFENYERTAAEIGRLIRAAWPQISGRLGG
jgi:protein-tyrosine-phosphatase